MTLHNSSSVHRGSTFFLKLVISFIALAVLAICTYFLLVSILSEEVGMYRPILIGMSVAAIPFFFGLYQAFLLLIYIDKNNAFSDLSVKALQKIKVSATIIGTLYAMGMPYIYLVAEKDDAPGVILIGLILTAAPIVIAVFAAVLQKLLQNALHIKMENDLTV